MDIGRSKISSSELMFSVACFIQGSILLVSFTTGITKQDTWIVVLLGMIISVPIILMYVSLAEKFPGKNLIQINDVTFGPYLGKLVSLCYIWFFMSLACLNLRDVGNFVTTYMLNKTPMIVILITFTSLCAWTVRKGIELIVRISSLFVTFIVIEVLMTFLLLFKDMDFTSFLPAFQLPLRI
jgi:spore germination protein KB